VKRLIFAAAILSFGLPVYADTIRTGLRWRSYDARPDRPALPDLLDIVKEPNADTDNRGDLDKPTSTDQVVDVINKDELPDVPSFPDGFDLPNPDLPKPDGPDVTIPEPGSYQLLLLGAGLMGLATRRWRNRAN
jgi:hypothetical protein